MAATVVKVTKMWSLADAAESIELGENTEGYQVTLDSADGAERVALTAVDPDTSVAVPKLRQAYQPGSFLRVKRKSAQAVSAMLYNVTVEYDDRINPSQTEENPLNRKAEIEWDTASSIDAIDATADGKAIVNSVQEPFDPPITDEFDDPVARLSWNRASLNVGYFLSFANKVNSDNYLGAKPGQALFRRPRAVYVQEQITINDQVQTFEYWQLNAEIHFREGLPPDNDTGGPARAWYRRVLNQGKRQKVGVDGDGNPIYAPIADEDGNVLDEPVLLAADGTLLPDGDPPVWLEFQTKHTRAFSTLQIPLPSHAT
jgi:hypothetical protein